MAYDNRDYWVCGLCPTSGILKNTPFQKVDLFQFSDEGFGDTGVEQTNGNSTGTVHISLLIWCWTAFCLLYSRNTFGMESYKFWTVSSEILYHSFWRSCFRDVGGGNLFLNVVSKTYHSGPILFRPGECAAQGKRWSSPLCFSNHNWIVPAVWMGALSSWKTAALFGNNV
jgi:hypothetical protein